MGKILRGLSDKSVWLKSLAEHDNVDKFVQLTCSASDFNHTLSSQIPYVPPMPKRKKTGQENWGMPDIVDSFLKATKGGLNANFP